MIKVIREKIANCQPSASVNTAAFIIAFSGIAGRVLGLLRDKILAAQFGAGDALDVYYAAFRVPDSVYNLLVLGALSAAFIPVFTSLIAHEKNEEAWNFVNNVFTVLLLLLILFALIFAFFAPWIMKLITPGFSENKMNEVVKLTRIMFLSPIFLGISGIFGGILNSMKRFLIYSLAPSFYNLGIIIGALFFTKFFGIKGLAYGVVLGAFLHMAIQYPAIRLAGFHYRFKINLHDKNFRRMLRLMLPRTMAIGVSQINLLVITIIASTLSSGSLAIFNFANNLQGFPIGVFGISFAIAAFPSLACFVARKENEQFAESFSKTLRQIIFFVLPISILMLVLRAQIVRVVLGSGKFDWEDTIITFGCLGILSLSLFAQSLIPLLARSFYALHNTRIPFFTGITSEVINLILAIYLSKRFGVYGLAWAYSIASLANMIFLYALLRIHLWPKHEKKMLDSLVKIFFASIIAGIVAQAGKYIPVPIFSKETFMGIFIQLVIAGSLGVFGYILIGYLIKVEELKFVRKFIPRRFIRSKDVPIVREDPTQSSGI